MTASGAPPTVPEHNNCRRGHTASNMELLAGYQSSGEESDPEQRTTVPTASKRPRLNPQGEHTDGRHKITQHSVGYVSKRKQCKMMVSELSRQQQETSDTPTHQSAAVDSKTQLADILRESSGCSDHRSKPIPTSRPARRVSCRLLKHTKPVLSLDWHPTNERLLLSASFDTSIVVWDALSSGRQPLAELRTHTGAVRTCRWVSGTHLISGGYDEIAMHTDMVTRSSVHTYKHDAVVSALALHPTDPNIFFTGDSAKHVRSWDTRTSKCLNTYRGAGGMILDLELLNNGQEIVASSDIVRKNAASQMMLIWETSSTIVRSNQIYTEPYSCQSLHAHPWDKTFLAQSNGDYVVIFSTSKPYRLNRYKRFEGHSVRGNPLQFSISPDGMLVCSASACGSVFFYNYSTASLVKKVGVSSEPTIAVSCHPTLPSTLACSSWDGAVHILQ